MTTETPSYRAARYAAERGITLADAGRKHGVSRQAVSLAWARLFPGAPPAPSRGRPRSADPRVHWITAGPNYLRASSSELDAFLVAAQLAGVPTVGAWLVAIAGGRRIKTARLRRLARAAAGMPEE